MEANYLSLAFILFFTVSLLLFFLRYTVIKRCYANMVVKDKENFLVKVGEKKETLIKSKAPANTWREFKKFRVKEKKVESWTIWKDRKVSDICSFVFEPVETPTPLPPFFPGQHLSFLISPDKVKKELAAKSDKLNKSEEAILEKLNLEGWWNSFKVGKTMYYSLSDGPSPNTFRVSIKRALPSPRAPEGTPPGIGSTFFHEFVNEGDLIETAMPKGHFYLDYEKQSSVVLVAGGIGITPSISIGKALNTIDSDREVILYYGVRNIGEVVLMEDMLKMSRELKSFKAYLCLSDPATGLKYDEEEGRITQNSGQTTTQIALDHAEKETYLKRLELIKQIMADPNIHIVTGFDTEGNLQSDLDAPKGCRVSVSLMKHQLEPEHKKYDFYLCGPPPMMKSVVTDLYHWNLPKDSVHWEGFGPCAVMWPGDVLNSPLKPCTVTFIDKERDEKIYVDWKPANGSIMNLADERSDKVPKIPRSCGAGFCGTCKTVYKGKVTYDSTPGASLKENECLPCVCKPDGDVIFEV